MTNVLKSKLFWLETAIYIIVITLAFNLLFIGSVVTDHEAQIALRGVGVGVTVGLLMKHLLDSFFKVSK